MAEVLALQQLGHRQAPHLAAIEAAQDDGIPGPPDDLVPGPVAMDAVPYLPGHGARKRNAEIWLWAELTCSPLAMSPAALPTARPRSKQSGQPVTDQYFWQRYARFYNVELPLVRDGLAAHARSLASPEPLRPLSEDALRLKLA